MADTQNIARPYAEAVFSLAQEQDNLAGWGDAIDFLATVAGERSIQRLINDPRVSAAQLEQLVLDLCGAAGMEPQVTNLVKLLVRNARLSALPDIARAYAARRAEAERVIEATMTTASELDGNQQQQFVDVLQNRLGRSVKLEFEVDPELIGGAVIRAGDWVIDGSVRAQLGQLVGALAA